MNARKNQIRILTLGLMNCLSLTACMVPGATENSGSAIGSCNPGDLGPLPNRLDVMIVKDTSASMALENARVADEMDKWVDAMPADVDYRVAVMLANGGTPSDWGKLKKIKTPNSAWILNSQRVSRDSMKAALRNKLTYVTDANKESTEGEPGLSSVNRILDHGMLTSSRAKGFFRQDAALMVMFVSDQKDLCAGSPSQQSKKKYCERKAPGGPNGPAHDEVVSPDLVLTKLQSVQGARPLIIGGAHYLDAASVPASGKSVGDGYIDLVQSAGGFLLDLAFGPSSGGLLGTAQEAAEAAYAASAQQPRNLLSCGGVPHEGGGAGTGGEDTGTGGGETGTGTGGETGTGTGGETGTGTGGETGTGTGGTDPTGGDTTTCTGFECGVLGV